jgi:FHA domain
VGRVAAGTLVGGSVRRSPIELKDIIAAERTGKPFLVWRAGDGCQQLLLLEPDWWRVTIGRDPAADVSLGWDTEVSRAHALLERVGQGWTLVDDGLSRHGSYVNGTRVLSRRRLADRDRLCFGVTEITYRDPQGACGDSTASVDAAVPRVPLSPMQRRILIALCRPVHESHSATPATNRQIADEVFLTVDAVKAHLRVLFDRYGLSDLPQNEKRGRLVAAVVVSGVIAVREF